MKKLTLIGILVLWPLATVDAQPKVPVEKWTGKTILLIGAHPDDDSQSHGTLSLLKANGNDVHVMLLTLGNVGTKDPELSRIELAKIRRQEETNALAELGIPEQNYITSDMTMAGSSTRIPKRSSSGWCSTSGGFGRTS